MEMAIWVKTEDLPAFLAGEAVPVSIHTPERGNFIKILGDPAKELKLDFSDKGQTAKILKRRK